MSVLFLILAAASAEGYVYSMTSVTDCAQTDKLYTRFYESGELSVLIPGLAEGIVPQGISYLPEENCLLFAGYRSDKGNSALLAVSLESGELVKEVILCLPDGTPYNGHAGGVCVTEKNIYISNAYMLLRISLDTFRALHADEIKYSWWSYRGAARINNVGWRIDYFLASERLMGRVQTAEIHDDIMGSDHCPISVELS